MAGAAGTEGMGAGRSWGAARVGGGPHGAPSETAESEGGTSCVVAGVTESTEVKSGRSGSGWGEMTY